MKTLTLTTLAMISILLSAPARAQVPDAGAGVSTGTCIGYDGSVQTCTPLASAPTRSVTPAANMNQALANATGAAIDNMIGALLFGNKKEDEETRNRAAAAAAAAEQERQAELEKQRALAEQKRQEMFDRLSHSLKLSGLTDLSLKGFDNNQGLQLKGFGPTSNANTDGTLQLKGFGNTATPAASGDLKPNSTDLANTGNTSANSSADSSDVNGCKPTGIAGLPGVYLNTCHTTQTSAFMSTNNPAQLAQAAQSLSGPERAFAEDSALHSAESKPELMAPSQDPRVANFQAADAEYQKAEQTQSQAAQTLDQAQQQNVAAKAVVNAAQSEIAKQQAAGSITPALQNGMDKLSAAAKTDEEASVRAQQEFDQAGANLAVSRTKATNALAALTPPSQTSAVDLSDKRRPLTLQSPSLAVRQGLNQSPLISGSGGSGGAAGLAAPGQPIVDCAGDRATLARLQNGLAVQQDAMNRTQAVGESAADESRDTAKEYGLTAISTLNSAATDIAKDAEATIAKEEGLKATGIAADAAARFKSLQNLKRIVELSDDLITVTEASEAGNAFGKAEAVKKTAGALKDQIDLARQSFVDTGMAEEAGGKLAFFLGGPVGESDFHLLITGMDLFAESWETWNNYGEAQQAQRNLDVMRSQYARVQDTISELQQEISQSCSK